MSRLNTLGFRATVTLEQGMRDLLEWARGAEAKDRVRLADAQLRKRGLRIE